MFDSLYELIILTILFTFTVLFVWVWQLTVDIVDVKREYVRLMLIHRSKFWAIFTMVCEFLGKILITAFLVRVLLAWLKVHMLN